MTNQVDTDALDSEVRLALFWHVAETAQMPDAETLATAVGQPRAAVEEALGRLAATRAIVLAPGGTNVWMANPFSAVPTPFRVEAEGRTYWGNCIWDALGIPAILSADATVTARCGDCGEALAVQVRDGAVRAEEGVVHFAVPARRWWENIGFT